MLKMQVIAIIYIKPVHLQMIGVKLFSWDSIDKPRFLNILQYNGKLFLDSGY
jgi:hypothetical protein